MSRKKITLLWASICIIASIVFYFGIRLISFNNEFKPKNLDEFPNTTNLLNSYYYAWQIQDWERMEAIESMYSSEFYKEELASTILSNWTILRAYFERYDDLIQFEAMLTINDADYLSRPKLAWSDNSENWVIINDFSLNQFHYDDYKEWYYKDNWSKFYFYSVACFFVTFIVGMIIVNVLSANRNKSKRQLDIDEIKNSGFASTAKMKYKEYLFAFDENSSKWLVLSKSGLLGKIFDIDEIIDCETYNLTGANAQGVVLKVTTTDLSNSSISIPFEDPITANEVVSMFKSAKSITNKEKSE